MLLLRILQQCLSNLLKYLNTFKKLFNFSFFLLDEIK